MKESGNPELVGAIARSDNFVRVGEIRGGPVIDWIRSAGLTQEEAARIQPWYEPVVDAQYFVVGLFLSLLPLKLVGARVGPRIAPGRYSAAFGRAARVTITSLLALFLAVMFAVSVYGWGGLPEADKFRTVMFIVGALVLVPTEMFWAQTLDSQYQNGKRGRGVAELATTGISAALVAVLGVPMALAVVGAIP
jgi:hypothetical protein